jgi:hypothetical protein
LRPGQNQVALFGFGRNPKSKFAKGRKIKKGKAALQLWGNMTASGTSLPSRASFA